MWAQKGETGAGSTSWYAQYALSVVLPSGSQNCGWDSWELRQVIIDLKFRTLSVASNYDEDKNISSQDFGVKKRNESQNKSSSH